MGKYKKFNELKAKATTESNARAEDIASEIMSDIPEIPEMSEEQLVELKRRIADFDNPVRYYIVSTLLMETYYDIESDCWSSCRKSSTGFKRKVYAELIQSQMKTKDHTLIKEF